MEFMGANVFTARSVASGIEKHRPARMLGFACWTVYSFLHLERI